MRIALIAALLAGCTFVSPIYTADGQKAYVVECGAIMSTCYSRAEDTCKGPWLPIDRNSSSTPFLMGSATGNTGMLTGGAIRRNELTFRCP